MGIISDILDSAETIASASAEATLLQWRTIVGGALALVIVLALLLLLVVSPQIGLAFGVIIVAALYLLVQGDTDLI